MPKTALHVFAHDAESTDYVVGTGGTLIGPGELVAERYNERGDELRNRFQRYGFDSDEVEKFESDLGNGAILLVIDDPELHANYKGKRRTPKGTGRGRRRLGWWSLGSAEVAER